MPPGMTYFPVASTTLDRFGAWKQAKSVVGGLPAGIYVLLSYYYDTACRTSGRGRSQQSAYLYVRCYTLDKTIFDEHIRHILMICINDCTTLHHRRGKTQISSRESTSVTNLSEHRPQIRISP